MNTRTIASAINERHPEPHLELFPPVLQRLLDALTPLQNDILPPVYFYLLPQRVLNEASLEYWYETRTEKAGMPLDRFYREKGGDVAWDAGEKHVREITALLKENPEGPFLQGKTVTYADFYWAGFLIFMRSMGEDVLGELLKRSGDEKVHLDFLKACERWTKRSDH
jgi:glutathione S-transferase